MTLDREYFEADNQNIGYRLEGFRDFATHFQMASDIIDLNPKSAIELGAARGYVAKRVMYSTTLLEEFGERPRVVAVDNSMHCYHTKVVDDEHFKLHDLGVGPYPFEDKEFDVCYSFSVLEHLPEPVVDLVIRESVRISNRGFHDITFSTSRNAHSDNTHVCLKTREWWENKFKEIDPNYKVMILEHDELYDSPSKKIPIPNFVTDFKKINFGSFTNMFYYDWRNVDILDVAEFAAKNKYLFMQHDLTQPLPYPDEYATLIFHSHLIEHFSRTECLRFLKECYRIMKTDATMRIAVPDTKFLMKKYLDGTIRDFKHVSKGNEGAPTDLEALMEVLLAGHKYAFDYDALKHILGEAGFTKILLCDPFHSSDATLERETFISHPTLSLVIEVKK